MPQKPIQFIKAVDHTFLSALVQKEYKHEIGPSEEKCHKALAPVTGSLYGMKLNDFQVRECFCVFLKVLIRASEAVQLVFLAVAGRLAGSSFFEAHTAWQSKISGVKQALVDVVVQSALCA